MIDTKLTPAPIDWIALAPMIAVGTTGVVAMILEMMRPRKTNNLIVSISLIGLAFAAALVLAFWNVPPRESFGAVYADASGHEKNFGLFIHDRFSQLVQLLLIGVCFFTVMFSEGYLREKLIPFGEYYPLVLWTTVGGMVMVTTRDLIILFLGLETLSISLYILAGLSSKEKRSQESALKYFLLGAFASSFMLYGIALMYGGTGTTHLSGITELFQANLADANPYRLVYAGLGMILVGFGFKAALVPFHMWTPDVYQGAPTCVTGFMAAGSKVAAYAALIRFLEGAMAMKDVWIPILMAFAVLSMTLGNLVAIVQRDAKRILGYSSIAHAGYILVAVVAWAKAYDRPDLQIGYETVLYYLLTYSLMTIGAFAVLTLSARGGKEGTLVDDYYGMYRRRPFAALAMVVFMVNLAGIPPFAGFFAKVFIFSDALETGLLWLALVLAVNSVISAYYYLRVAFAVFVQEPEWKPTRFAPMNLGLLLTCGITAVLLLAILVFTSPILREISIVSAKIL
ncbi:MAG TPA: NADH-quinone oxidoreductase subunit N [Fimbriimonadales bacterium]|nr:NADH-quinone oxidoreductase subunit N [Fimbriimonadales bacterium]